ncbi:MAG: Fic family protein [Cupriavidus sp.]|nr:Fic family protein [Cupriavidus sp.]MCA3196310.1 Fic family protein [Cupriavidus sp.]MCA3202055.1 Fic family protein [Cupriavidus sp.]MCA3207104.1 Fic family protein [Cupriavidus sp.]QWE95999.1 Fic family protein [Cupriavidus sp. EM10]
MRLVGYARLREQLDLPTVPVIREARAGATTRILETADAVLFPRKVAPAEDAPALAHVLFALKHEGVNLAILAGALPAILQTDLQAELDGQPNSRYSRIAALLWEHFTGNTLTPRQSNKVPYVDLFDSVRYYTAEPGRLYPRWRVRFNGLGSLDQCVTVHRTDAIQAVLDMDIFARMDAFIATVGKDLLDRALNWAYLSETEKSFEIERERPTMDKSERFVRLLHHAHERRPLDETYLTELQNDIISNPYDQAMQYRSEQNWLRRGGHGAASVTYVPPHPDDVPALMEGLESFANSPPRNLDPLIVASVVSFWFVFIHPFMDGNGRLSRFLIHHTLCRSGKMAKGFLLPVSVAIKRHESDYLAALESFSKPVRALWRVWAIGDHEFDCQTTAGSTPYRYWDATSCVEFGVRMVKEALEHDLQAETQFLQGYDQVVRRVEAEFDVRNHDLATLIASCFREKGRISNRWRKQLGTRVQPDAFDAIEAAVREVFFAEAGAS